MKGEGTIVQVFTSCGHTNHILPLKWMKHFKTKMVAPSIYVTLWVYAEGIVEYIL